MMTYCFVSTTLSVSLMAMALAAPRQTAPQGKMRVSATPARFPALRTTCCHKKMCVEMDLAHRLLLVAGY